MPYALAQTASNHRDLLDKILEFITAESCTVAAVNAGGSGYVVGDVLTVSGGTSTIAVELVVTSVSSGAVTAVRISQSGAYTVTPSNPVSVTGGSGTGATFNLTFNGGNGWTVNRRTQEAVSATISAAGTGYSVGDTVTIAGGVDVDTAPIFDVDEIGAESATVQAGGSGYSVSDTLTLSGGTSSAVATFNVDSVDGGGAVTGVSLVSAGSYSVPPSDPVSTTGGTGTGATLNVTFGDLTAVSLNTAGKLGEVPSNPASTTTSGGGSGATLTVTYQDHTSTNFDALIQGEGSGDDEIFAGLRTFTRSSANNLELRGATGYDSAAPFGTQPGISPGDNEAGISADQQGCYVPLDSSAMTYWLFVSGRRIVGVFKVGASTYTNMYLGWLNPFGTETDFPYPLVVGGCSSAPGRIFSSGDTGYSGMLDPISDDGHTTGPMLYRDPAGQWNQVHNSQGSGSGRTAQDDFVVWPAGTPTDDNLTTDDKVSSATHISTDIIPNTGNPGTPAAEIKQTPESPDYLTLLWPTMLIRAGDGGSIPRDLHGELEGIYWASADIDNQAAVATSEDTFTDPATGDRYHIFQNCNRTELFTHFAILEA